MKNLWIVSVLLTGIHGCGMIGATRQVVVSPSTLDDYRSPAWVILSVPAGARLPTEDPED